MGAKNCPETPRQKMIGMMYLVLTAMLALNVSADILNGFDMVNNSLINTIENADVRNKKLYDNMEFLNSVNPTKVGVWLEKSKEVRKKSNALFSMIQTYKKGIIKNADGDKADTTGNSIIGRDNTSAAGQYVELGTTQKKGKDLKAAIDDYRKFVEKMFDNDTIKVKIYDKMFNTNDVKKSKDEPEISWIENTFADMPAAAVITLLSKYQSDIRTTEAELIQYFMQQQDAGDFRVNKIEARIIPESKHVIQGGHYRAKIALMAIDTTKTPKYYLGNKTLKTGFIDIPCGTVGTFPIKGYLEIADKDGNPLKYSFQEEYTVGAPTATIANTDMNVVYRGYNNKMEVSVPGVPTEKLKISATGATMKKEGKYYICIPAQTTKEHVTINVSAEIEGKIQSMGQSQFRVRTLPSPTAFLSINGEVWQPGSFKIRRRDLINGKMIAQYEDGMLNANFIVTEFTLSVSDGRGGFNSSKSDGSKFSANQKRILEKLKPGAKVIIEKIKYSGAKKGELSFPTIALP